MIRILPLLVLLAACGVDGAPIAPKDVEENKPEPGVTVSGNVSVGIGGTL